MTEDLGSRRERLLLDALRLSRDPSGLTALEGALTVLDDGRRPWASPADEQAILRTAMAKVSSTFEPAAYGAWADEYRSAIQADIAVTNEARLGRAERPDLPPVEQAAMAVAGELQARMDAGEHVVAGDKTSTGWEVVAHLDLDAALAYEAAHLWALSGPSDAFFIVATGGVVPEVCAVEQVIKISARRQEAARQADFFVRIAADGSLAARKRQLGALRDVWRELDEMRAARESEQRIGDVVFHCVDGQPESATGVLLPGGGETAARRLDQAPGAAGEGDTPFNAQVWHRPLGDGLWRRGRLHVEGDAVLFIDEPGAIEVGTAPLRALSRSLEQDLQDSEAIKTKARRSLVYTFLLFRALQNSDWRHRDGSLWQGGDRSTGDLVSNLAGQGDYVSFLWNGSDSELDEEVIADLGALGWSRER